MFKRNMLSVLLLLGIVFLPMGIHADYEPSDHDREFVEMLGYKIQETINYRGPESKPEVIGILRVFSNKYKNSNPRFSRLMTQIADQLENTLSEKEETIIEKKASPYNLECQSPASEENVPLKIDKIEIENKEVKFYLSSNPKWALPATLPTSSELITNGIAHCSARSKKPIPGGTETLAIYGVRGKPYSLGLSHQKLKVASKINLGKTIIGTMDIPETLENGDYSFMCQLIVQQIDPENPEVYHGSFDSVYYYFDVEI